MKPTAARRRIWTDEKDAKLIALHRGGNSYIYIARTMAQLERSRSSGRGPDPPRCLRCSSWEVGEGCRTGRPGSTVTRLGIDHSEPKRRDLVEVVPELSRDLPKLSRRGQLRTSGAPGDLPRGRLVLGLFCPRRLRSDSSCQRLRRFSAD